MFYIRKIIASASNGLRGLTFRPDNLTSSDSGQGTRVSAETKLWQDPYTNALPLARDSSLLVTIPLWYRPHRLGYLADMVRTLSEFAVRQMEMIILTQSSKGDEIDIVRRLTSPYESASKTFRIVPERDLSDQFSLCWKHRDLIKDVFLNSDIYTHFIYFEDDIRFSFLNFCYFLSARSGVGACGLIPSFVRVEYNSRRLGYFSTDQMGCSTDDRGRVEIEKELKRQGLKKRKHVICDGQMFVTIANPYCAAYVLDHELAEEFVASRSFDRAQSQAVTHWGVPERAAMGLCFENVPDGWSSRYVVPVDVDNLIPAHRAWIYHLPNNFTHQNAQPWGQRTMDEFFDPPLSP